MAGFPTHNHAALQRAEIKLPALLVDEEDHMLPPPLSRRIQEGLVDASLGITLGVCFLFGTLWAFRRNRKATPTPIGEAIRQLEGES